VVILWIKILIGLNLSQILYSSQLTLNGQRKGSNSYSFDYVDPLTSSHILYLTAIASFSRTMFRPLNLQSCSRSFTLAIIISQVLNHNTQYTLCDAISQHLLIAI